jgi:hypothetical protein
LIEAGAKQLLIPNLPLLGETPAYRNNTSDRQKFNGLATSFNEGLASLLGTFEAGYGELSVFRLDVARFFGEAIASPADFGLVNVVQPAAAGLEPGMWSYDEDGIATNPGEYLFWDEVHPTAAGHALLAERALDLVQLPGDFNRDGEVDAADYLVWRNSLGKVVPSGTQADGNGDSTVDARDYRLWQLHFGRQLSDSALVLHPIPEPAGTYSLLCLTTLVVLKRRCGRAAIRASTGDAAH